ncbi:aminoacyltransferase [Bacillus cereus]|uniref:aminoacyltransferase n=1 Tax=Bacillus cereus TaxID=1396 RepID=UPI0010BD0EC9|nr:aminoacyltransferase [Bacillus cereus]TKH64938.1 aminoacyltransferase [Bacillus cereus]
MMNRLKGIIAGAKVKQQEMAQKELDKVLAQESDLQSRLSKAQSNQSKIQQALTVVEASLVIDENDKAALAQQKKAQGKLEELAKEIESTQEKLVEVAEKKREATREVFRSRGDLARKHNVKAHLSVIAPARINKALGIEEDVFRFKSVPVESKDLATEYGFVDTQSLQPVSSREEDQNEDFKTIVQMNNEDHKQASEQADAIAREIEEAIKNVFEKNDIELSQQTLINLSRI